MKLHHLLIILTALASSCSHLQHRKAPATEAELYREGKQTRHVAEFNKINVQGPIYLDLHTGYKKPYVIITGDASDLAQVKTEVKNNTLYIAIAGRNLKHGSVHVDVRGHYLNEIRYNGGGDIVGTRLKTSSLDVILSNGATTKLGGSIGLRRLEVSGSGFTQISGITTRDLDLVFKGDPKVQLTGQAGLRQLNINGSGWLSMYWVKSDTLKIRARKSAKIQLAGIVNRLDVELWDKAQFKGRYLRAQRSFVKTHGRSVAEIASVNHQSNLATNSSNIYYYNLPGTRADFMATNGSVLDMRDWQQTELHDFTRYNKQFP